MKKLKAIWRLIRSKYFVLIVWDGQDEGRVQAHYKKEHKETYPLVNDVIEDIWKHKYYEGDDV